MKTLWSQIPFKKVILVLLILGGLFWALQNLPVKEWSLEISQFAQSQGMLGAFVFGLIYVMATLFLFPCAFLTFAAGMAYGYWAIPLVVVAAATGSSLAFIISRFFAKEPIENLMAKRRETKALKMAIEEEGWRFLVLIRMSPFIPFNVNSYFLGTLHVTFNAYIWATLIGCLPGTLLYVYLGILGTQHGEGNFAKWILFAVGVLATYVLARITLKRTQEILSSREFTTSSSL